MKYYSSALLVAAINAMKLQAPSLDMNTDLFNLADITTLLQTTTSTHQEDPDNSMPPGK